MRVLYSSCTRVRVGYKYQVLRLCALSVKNLKKNKKRPVFDEVMPEIIHTLFCGHGVDTVRGFSVLNDLLTDSSQSVRELC